MKSYERMLWLDHVDTIQFCALETLHHAAYNKLDGKLPDELHFMLPSTLWCTFLIVLDCTLPACLTVCSQLLSMALSLPAWLILPSKLWWCSQVNSVYAPKCILSRTPLGMLSRTLLIALHSSLPSCLTVCSQVIYQDTLKYTAKHALKYTPYCTRWHSLSLQGHTLECKL